MIDATTLEFGTDASGSIPSANTENPEAVTENREVESPSDPPESQDPEENGEGEEFWNAHRDEAPKADEIVTPAVLNVEYRYVRMLGEGANGRTWLAKDRRNSLDVAIKELKFVDNFKALEMFKREAEVLESISVEGVPKFYKSVFSDDFTSYIIQEYVPYPSLEDYLEQGEIFDEDEAFTILRLVSRILFALQTQYAPAIIHRDIKPGNILYKRGTANSDPCVWLIDFGSVDNAHKQSSGSTIAGTFGYMAPEQLQGEVSPRSDFYGLGATILHLITGVFPYEIPSELFQLQFHPVIEEKAPQTTPAMVNLLDAMLASAAEKRPADIEALRSMIFKAEEASKRYRKVEVDWDDSVVIVPTNDLERWYFKTRLGRFDVRITEGLINWRRRRKRERALRRIDKEIQKEKERQEAYEKAKQEALEVNGIQCRATVRRVSVATIQDYEGAPTRDVSMIEGIFCHDGDWYGAFVLQDDRRVNFVLPPEDMDPKDEAINSFQVRFMPTTVDTTILPQTIVLSQEFYRKLVGLRSIEA